MIPFLFGIAPTDAEVQDPISRASVEARIERYRKGDAKITVVDISGKPIRDAEIEVEMVRHRFWFGCNAFQILRREDPAQEAQFQKLFAGLFNYGTLPFYWGTYEPEPGKKREAELKAQAEWLKKHGMTAKGHPLVWHEVYPKWGPQDVETTKTMLKARIEEIVKTFKGLVDMWDVINEAQIAPKFKSGVSEWVKQDGPVKVVDQCLRWAHDANPEATLLYNDYQVDDGMIKLLDELVALKSPFHAIGLQSHMHPGEVPLTEIWERCEKFAKYGLPLHFTELTVISGKHGWMLKPWPDEEGGEARQEAYVEQLYRLLFSHPAMQAIIWWDLDDGHWMDAPSGLVRKDLSPKPAYTALQKLVHETWWTREKGKTDGDGTFAFRGFFGTYRIKATHRAFGKTVEVELDPGKTGQYQIML